MAEKPVYTKPLSLEDLGYIPEELEELKKKHAANWKDNSVNINVEGYGQGRLVINNQLGGKVRFYPDEANKAANIQTAKNLSRANEIFNLPATLSPLLSTAVGARMLVHRRGLNRAKSLYMKVDENLNIADAKNVTPGTSTLTGTTTKGTIKPGFVTDSSGQLVSPGYDTGYRSFLQRGRNEKNYPIASKAVNLLKDVSNELSLARKAKVGKFSKYVDPKDTYFTPFGPYPLKTKPIDNVPKIQTNLNKLVLNKKTSRDTLYNALNTNTAQNLDSKHLKFTIDDIIDQGFAKQLGLRQGALSSVSRVLPGYIRRRDELAAIPKEIRSKGLSRDPHKGAEKNVKTNFRSLRDLSSLNLLTKHKDIFKINRQGIKDALVTFKIGDKEWHHTFFGNKEGGKLFLNEVAQDPVVAINLMAKLQELNLPTSGVVENLALIEKYEDSTGIGHNKLHNIYRELGLEQGGDLDFAEIVDAVTESYLAGDKTAINHLFTLLEVYAERTAPFMAEQTKKAGGKMFKDTGVEQVPAVQKYSPKSAKFRTN
jgi:hypothetical protein